MSLRSDHIPRGGGVQARCQGHPCQGETMDIDIARVHWKEAQQETKFFEERGKPIEVRIPEMGTI